MSGASDILVVEDDELVQSFLCRALTGVGGKVVACATGAEALEAAATHGFAIVLLDGLLPDMHGVELGKRLLTELAADAPGICIVSGMLRYAHPVRDGVAALPKPLRVRELVTTIGELIAWRSDPGGGDPAARRAALDGVAVDLLVS
ncbi:MAG: response regulator transcription factor [Candidatus Dormibacteria bacterium]